MFWPWHVDIAIATHRSEIIRCSLIGIYLWRIKPQAFEPQETPGTPGVLS
jgi:hypothetical protein